MKHCSRCNLNVYNLSEMTETEALELVQKTEGRLCVRYYQRTDGKIMTRDCKVGMAAFRMRLARSAAFAAGLTLTGFGITFANLAKPGSANAAAVGNFTDRVIDTGRSNPVIGPLIDKIAPQALAGDVAMPMPPPGP